jgi:hypothetical protein
MKLREESRYHVQVAADLQVGDDTFEPVRITNLSRSGCRFTVRRDSALARLITIVVGRVGHLDAEVKWRSGKTYGVRFDAALPQVVLDHMRLFLSEQPALVAEREAATA